MLVVKLHILCLGEQYMAEKEVACCRGWHKLLHRSFAMGLSVAVTTGNYSL